MTHAHMVADAGAGGAGRAGKRRWRCRGVSKYPADGVQDEGGLLPRGDGFADLVLGHHLGEGLGDGLGARRKAGIVVWPRARQAVRRRRPEMRP